jgi:hypothetical protein
MFPKKVKILGDVWKIKIVKEQDDEQLEGLGGYCDPFTKTIVVCDYREDVEPDRAVEIMRYVLRHEINHAYLFSSGLWNNSNESGCWAMNEEMVDWLAIQNPKIFKTYQECRCI